MKANNTGAVSSDTYRKILNYFTGDNENRPEFMKPFIQDEFVIATDTYTIIYLKKDLFENIDFATNDEVVNALALIPQEDNINAEFDTLEMRKKISEIRELANNTYEIKKEKCPDCHGEGMIEYEFYDHKNKRHTVDEICPTCEHDSDFQIIRYKKTGERIEYFREIFKVYDCLLNVNYFEKIVKVAELLSLPKFKLVYANNNDGKNKFIVGEATILVMTLWNSNNNDLVLNII